MEIGAAELAPGGGLSASVAEGIAVVNNVLSKGIHCSYYELFYLRVLRAEDIICKLIDEKVTDNLIGAGVSLINDVADIIAGADKVVPKPFGNLSGGVNRNAAEVFAVEKIARGAFLFC